MANTFLLGPARVIGDLPHALGDASRIAASAVHPLSRRLWRAAAAEVGLAPEYGAERATVS
jgi:hypothetical protein